MQVGALKLTSVRGEGPLAGVDQATAATVSGSVRRQLRPWRVRRISIMQLSLIIASD